MVALRGQGKTLRAIAKAMQARASRLATKRPTDTLHDRVTARVFSRRCLFGGALVAVDRSRIDQCRRAF
jgi:hypothetical protein